MPVTFTRSDVEALAALAQLELDAAEADLFGRQLADILEYARQVQRIDTTGVPPTTSVSAFHDVDRPDEVRASLDTADVLMNAPDPAAGSGLFRVPRVIG
jgi:aspartyl-tRNA(Asn)/glutamyl-tRNA(Gln) amidotransferase subunit C